MAVQKVGVTTDDPDTRFTIWKSLTGKEILLGKVEGNLIFAHVPQGSIEFTHKEFGDKK